MTQNWNGTQSNKAATQFVAGQWETIRWTASIIKKATWWRRHDWWLRCLIDFNYANCSRDEWFLWSYLTISAATVNMYKCRSISKVYTAHGPSTQDHGRLTIFSHWINLNLIEQHPTEDIAILNGSTWLNDTVIHAYLCLLTPNWTLITSTFSFISCQRLWTADSERLAISKCSTCALPLDSSANPASSHWKLLVADTSKKTAQIADSLPTSNNSHYVSMWSEHMETRSNAVLDLNGEWTEHLLKTLQQQDGHTSGIIMLMVAVLKQLYNWAKVSTKSTSPTSPCTIGTLKHGVWVKT